MPVLRRIAKHGAAWLCLTLALARPAQALDCPLLKDRSARSWARSFDEASTIIFRARVTSLQFEKMDGQWPVYLVGYHVLETIKGAVDTDFVSLWAPWCDACSVEEARRAHLDLVDKVFLVQGQKREGLASSTFRPSICWPFVALPFGWANGDLLTELRTLARQLPPPR